MTKSQILNAKCQPDFFVVVSIQKRRSKLSNSCFFSHQPMNIKVFLQRQIWIVNYEFKSLSKNLSNENINTGVSVVFKTKCELNAKTKYFSGNTNFFGFHY